MCKTVESRKNSNSVKQSTCWTILKLPLTISKLNYSIGWWHIWHKPNSFLLGISQAQGVFQWFQRKFTITFFHWTDQFGNFELLCTYHREFLEHKGRIIGFFCRAWILCNWRKIWMTTMPMECTSSIKIYLIIAILEPSSCVLHQMWLASGNEINFSWVGYFFRVIL